MDPDHRLSAALAYANRLAAEEALILRKRRKAVILSSVVYIVGDDDLPTVKIGRTSDIASRLSALRNQSGRAGLRIIDSVITPVALRVERLVHMELRHGRVLGEWFLVSHREAMETLRRIAGETSA